MTDRLLLLHDYLREIGAARPAFQPGTFDGALLTAGWVARLTGEDPAARFRNRYTTFRRGLALLRKAGFATLEDIAAKHAAPVSGWMAARPGDIALITTNDLPCLGIVGVNLLHVASARGGLDVVPVDRAEKVLRP